MLMPKVLLGRSLTLLQGHPGIVLSYIIPILSAFALGKESVSWLWILLLGAASLAIAVYGVGRWLRFEQVATESVVTEPVAFDRASRPSWLVYPDVERAQWANMLLDMVWQHLKDDQEGKLMQSLTKTLQEAKPALLTSLSCTEVNIGDRPPKILGVKGYICSDDEYMLDLNLKASSNSKLTVTARAPGIPADLNFSVENLQIEGILRLVCRGFTNKAPYWSHLGITIVEVPTINFSIRTIGFNITTLPGVQTALERVLKVELFKHMLFPEMIDIKLIDEPKPAPVRATPRPLHPAVNLRIRSIVGDATPLLSSYDASVEFFLVSKKAHQELVKRMDWIKQLGNKEKDAPVRSLLSPRGSEPHDTLPMEDQQYQPMHKIKLMMKRARNLAEVLTTRAPSPTIALVTGGDQTKRPQPRRSKADIEELRKICNAPPEVLQKSSILRLMRLCLQHWSAFYKLRAPVHTIQSASTWESWNETTSIDLTDRSEVIVAELFVFNRVAEERHFVGLTTLSVDQLLNRQATEGGEIAATEVEAVRRDDIHGVAVTVPLHGAKMNCVLNLDVSITLPLTAGHRRKASGWMPSRAVRGGRARGHFRKTSKSFDMAMLQDAADKPPLHPTRDHPSASAEPIRPHPVAENASEQTVDVSDVLSQTLSLSPASPAPQPRASPGGEPAEVEDVAADNLAAQSKLSGSPPVSSKPWRYAKRLRSMTMMAELGSMCAALSLIEPATSKASPQGRARYPSFYDEVE